MYYAAAFVMMGIQCSQPKALLSLSTGAHYDTFAFRKYHDHIILHTSICALHPFHLAWCHIDILYIDIIQTYQDDPAKQQTSGLGHTPPQFSCSGLVSICGALHPERWDLQPTRVRVQNTGTCSQLGSGSRRLGPGLGLGLG